MSKAFHSHRRNNSQGDERNILLIDVQVLNQAMPQEVIEAPFACMRNQGTRFDVLHFDVRVSSWYFFMY